MLHKISVNKVHVVVLTLKHVKGPHTLYYKVYINRYTLNRKSPTRFVRTKPISSVVITKPLPLGMSLYACKASWLYYIALYYQILLAESLCFTMGTVNSFAKNKWKTAWHVCLRTFFVGLN